MDNDTTLKTNTTIPYIAFAILVLIVSIFFFTKDKARQQAVDKSQENAIKIQQENINAEQKQ